MLWEHTYLQARGIGIKDFLTFFQNKKRGALAGKFAAPLDFFNFIYLIILNFKKNTSWIKNGSNSLKYVVISQKARLF